jgi:hypothetical protein
MGTKKTDTIENPLQALSEAMNSEGCSDEVLSGNYVVPASPVFSASSQQLADILSGPALMQDSGKGIAASKLIKHYDGDRFKSIQEALKTTEKENFSPSHYMRDGGAIIMPGSVRERPNSLYYRINSKGQVFALRDKADKITTVIFGDEAKRVYEAAARSGFNLKPLVYVSQVLYDHINNGIKHDYEEYAKIHGDEGFDEDTDENGLSPWIQAMYLFLEQKTVKDLSREARYRNISVLTVMRCIMSDVCSERGIPLDFGTKKVEEKE